MSPPSTRIHRHRCPGSPQAFTRILGVLSFFRMPVVCLRHPEARQDDLPCLHRLGPARPGARPRLGARRPERRRIRHTSAPMTWKSRAMGSPLRGSGYSSCWSGKEPEHPSPSSPFAPASPVRKRTLRAEPKPPKRGKPTKYPPSPAFPGSPLCSLAHRAGCAVRLASRVIVTLRHDIRAGRDVHKEQPP